MNKHKTTFLKEKMKEAGYIYIKNRGDGSHVLLNKNTGEREVWANSKGHAGYSIAYKNTELEFCSSIK